MINFKEFLENREAGTTASSNNSDGKIPYFSMANGESGEYVIDFDPESAMVHKFHSYFIDGKSSKIKCIYERGVAGSSCPLCQKAFELREKDPKNPFAKFASDWVYLRVFDMEGNFFVWERTVNWVANNIMPIIQQYGDLSSIILTISRTGEKLETKYSLIPKTQRDGRNITLAEVPKNILTHLPRTQKILLVPVISLVVLP